MIHLIAADMDGTLLDSRKRLPKGLFSMIRQLREKDVRFVVASGRQYYNLEAQFEEVADQVTFLSENGTMVFDQGKLVILEEMPAAHFKEIVGAVRKVPGANAVLCGVHSAYIEGRDPELIQNVGMYYKKYEIVDDLLNVKDRICKVAVYDLISAEENVWPKLKKLEDQYAVTLSGDHWVDVMEKGVTKGTALEALEKLFGVSPEETMAFGDYLNDLEMMKSCYYSYAMANAHPLLKAAARFEAPSNDENGVMRVIREKVGLSFCPDCREIAFGSPEYQDELSLRDEILRRPIGRSLADDDLSGEGKCSHLGIFDGNWLLGCAVLQPQADGKTVRMMQVAVREAFRGHGFGRELAVFAEQKARQLGVNRIQLHARKTALGFYEKLGFEMTGGEFQEVGIPHYPMEKRV